VGGTLVIDEPEILADEPVTFRLTGCTPGEIVAVSASWVVGDEEVRSEARFEAPETGVIEPGRLASLGGTYTGVEPYGLWSLIEIKDARAATRTLDPWTVSVTAAGQTWESSGSLVRRKLPASVRMTDLASGPLRGAAFTPAGSGPFPAVLLVSGSGGGITSVQTSAALLASRGFATLALAYFNYPDLPSELVNIPLEYFRDGLDWLTANVPTTGRVAVMGESRGGELALLLGSSYPDKIAAVVAMVPSGVVWGGLRRERSTVPAAAWTREGSPVPALPGSSASRADPPPERAGAVVLTPSFEASLAAAQPEAFAAAQIPVERCGGPVLMLSGEDDALWPSTALAEIAVQRGRMHGAGFPIRHLRYPDAGHAFVRPAGFPVPASAVHPVTGEHIAYGGSPAGNAHASASSWREITEFLRASLPVPAGTP
jgi:dienelactone hydrolase